MPLFVVDHAALSDTGHVRRSNEDSLLDAPPLFVVADGMGGARAGEIASQICVETFRALKLPAAEQGLDAASVEEALQATIAEANRRIFERAGRDPATSGMGTTVTAAVLAADAVVFGHVGDSRAYVYRDGVFQQLSEDHSLVGELVRSGALSPQDAEVHPHRSVITRVLGTEPEVEVDTWSITPRPGDVYLLCSDGLTGMVGDERIAEILDVRPALRDAARELVRAANAAGGDDNVTALLFRVGDETTPVPAPVDVAAEERHRPLRVEDVEGRPRTLRRMMRRAAVLLTLAVVLVAAAAAAVYGLSWSHFVGAEPDGRVAVYQGVPWEIGWGVRLYRPVEISSVPAATLTQDERRTLFDHRLRSDDSARAVVRRLAASRPWERADEEAAG